MGKFMKPGKVVMVLAGRYAGRKAVIVKVKHRSVDASCCSLRQTECSTRDTLILMYIHAKSRYMPAYPL